jgi:hypothetical protein
MLRMSIPTRIHFCWIGPVLPWAYVFAVLSAAAQGNMDEVVLHHTDALQDGPELAALRHAPSVRLNHIDPAALLGQAEAQLALLGGLTSLYNQLKSPVMRADVLRAAILYLEGGVYLDMDTITVAALRPLLSSIPFIGAERIVWPHWVRLSRSPFVWARHLALDVLRTIWRLVPGGWRGFHFIEGWYVNGVNNAIMGSPPGAPLFAAYLRSMAALPVARLGEPYALGPDMLQALIIGLPPEALTIHKPEVFYPFAPEISAHWFRPTSNPKLDLALKPETRIVHWYASVRSKPYVAVITPVRAHRHDQLYSALVCRALPHLQEHA